MYEMFQIATHGKQVYMYTVNVLKETLFSNI